MTKKEIPVKPYLYPMPVVLVGANVEGKPNFMPIAWTCIVEYSPPTILISASKTHHTSKGIRDNKTFSVNTPSEELVEATDYCGIVSGKEFDKSRIFNVFYGELKTAPMITEAPLNLECKVVQHHEYKSHEIFFGEIVHAHAEERFLKGEVPDIAKIKPFVFSMSDNNYWKLGGLLGKAWRIGRNYKKNKHVIS